MPIHRSIETIRISQDDFGLLADEVMHHVFEIHNEYGRLFDEIIYKQELARRINGVDLEVPVSVSHGPFSKAYQIDVLVNGCGLFEFKAADTIHSRHRGQTVNYLLLADIAHGKIVNIRSDRVQHEFVNCRERLINLRNPSVVFDGWGSQFDRADELSRVVLALIADWGAGLETSLYEDAASCLLGGDLQGLAPIAVMGTGGQIGKQRVRLVSHDAGFRVTGLTGQFSAFKIQIRKMLRHLPIRAMHWIDVTHGEVRFTTVVP